jgi:hypothetical protein
MDRFERFVDKVGARFLNSPAYLLFVALALLWLIGAPRAVDPDLFARLAIGKLVFFSGTVPQTDPFAFTTKFPRWYDHEWLSGVVFFEVWHWLGEWGLMFFKAVLATLTLLLLKRAAESHGRNLAGWHFWLLFTGLQLSYLWVTTVRSQIFTYLFLAWVFCCIEQHRTQKKTVWLWSLPITFVVWANAHGGFIVGLGFLCMYTAVAIVRSSAPKGVLIFVTVLSLMAPFCNPYGPEYLQFILKATTMSRPSITEWAAVSLSDPAGIFYLVVVTFVIVALYRARRIPTLDILGMLTLSIYFGARHQRLTAIFFMVAFVYFLPELQYWVVRFVHLFGTRAEKLRRTVVFSAMMVSIPLAFFALNFLLAAERYRLNYDELPVAALAWLAKSQQRGNLLVDFNRGSYALWKLYPNVLISVDGRYEEVYPDATVQRVAQALTPTSPNFKAALAEIAPTHILLHKQEVGKGLEEYLERYEVQYEDSKYLILADRSAGLLVTRASSSLPNSEASEAS